MKRFESDKVARLNALAVIPGRADIECGKLALDEARHIADTALLEHDGHGRAAGWRVSSAEQLSHGARAALAEALAEIIAYDGPVVAVAA